jgi:tRNA threonylcarbamoyladenosine biosynthesis protein TsaB
MKILAADTALGACSVAVISGDRVLAHAFTPMERGHAEALAPMVEKAMADAGLSFKALERLAVTIGPGTFTGQRVGLSFMRGLRVALKIPLLGLTSLAVMAQQAMAESGASRAAAIHDARRDEVYLEVVDPERSGHGPALVSFAEAVARIAALANVSSIALAGTAQSRVNQTVTNANILQTAIVAPDALWLARLSAGLAPSDETPKPLYLRAPDAKIAANHK